jgi:hypothetical protein
MYTLVHKINVLQANVSGLQTQLAHMYHRQTPQQNERDVAPVVKEEHLLEIQNKIEELSKSINKIQIDFTTKQTEIKKESVARDEDIRRDIKLLETTLPIKLEQLVNKIVKDRIDQLGKELKNSIKSIELTSSSAINTNDEDFEINVTLTGENDAAKESAKKTKVSRSKKSIKSSGDI